MSLFGATLYIDSFKSYRKSLNSRILGFRVIQVPFEADLIFNDFSRKRSIFKYFSKIVSEYDQKIPQSQTADKPMAGEEEPLNHHETP